MASVSASAILSLVCPPRQSLQLSNGLSGFKSVSLSIQRKNLQSIRLHSAPVSLSIQRKNLQSIRLHSAPQRFRVSCAAKPETLDKVCEIVKKQLALAEETVVTGESTFAQLGADSLDTVEVVMGLEEEFEISVEEESAQNIQTVQDAANLIEKLVEKKSSAA